MEAARGGCCVVLDGLLARARMGASVGVGRIVVVVVLFGFGGVVLHGRSMSRAGTEVGEISRSWLLGRGRVVKIERAGFDGLRRACD